MNEKYLMNISCDGKCKICEHYKKAYLLQQENKQLKDRINKAIEWVIDWTHDPNNYFEVDTKPSELLEILKEDNKEEK